MIINIIIMAWLAFNLVWFLDVCVTLKQKELYKSKTPKHLWRNSKMPKRAFLFEKAYWWAYILLLPYLAFAYASLFVAALIVSIEFAIRAFFNTFFETLKGGAR